ncbi:leukocyte-associated immunoglobulin-like receptor 2 isoform X2 [Octodon degus]|uniref:Leukocyte-associated immunoglobulin-like receptor 2 isoform X2 n=1 Tax=Octodon degus TaxID=10160 RepID=A0A6P6DX32_OCTDE|nr:leukocyte-associated immunoglobulin-like receptor 2 isoform X2 [Octodon degus]
MPPQPISLLVLGLCLGQEILTQDGPLPAPSITAELGSMTSGGRAVTIMCQAQGSIERFRLEKCSAGRCSAIIDYTTTSFSENEARFYLTLTNAGQYSCMYQNSSMWSSRSEILELAVTGGDVTQTVQSPTSALPSDLSPGILTMFPPALICLPSPPPDYKPSPSFSAHLSPSHSLCLGLSSCMSPVLCGWYLQEGTRLCAVFAASCATYQMSLS